MPGTIRAFIAVDVNDDIRNEVQILRDQFRQAKAQIKWIDQEACHLTLKFLGQIDQQQLDSVTEACAAVAQRHLPFQLTFQGLGAFPRVRNLRVLWMGISEGREELLSLQQDMEQSLAQVGFPEDSRTFEPHLTLGRLKEPLSRAQMLFFSQLIDGYTPIRFGVVQVDSLRLMRSVLRPSGAVYSVLESYRLGAPVPQITPPVEAME